MYHSYQITYFYSERVMKDVLNELKPSYSALFYTKNIHMEHTHILNSLIFLLTSLYFSTPSHRPLHDDEGVWDGQVQNAYSLVTGVNPQQRYQPTQGSYQLQFAIQQLQQQRRRSRQFSDQSLCRHQVHEFSLIIAPKFDTYIITVHLSLLKGNSL